MPTFVTPEPISVTVDLGVGDLRIAASDRADTVVQVEPSDPTNKSDVVAAQKTAVEYSNGVLRVKGSKKRYTFRGGGESIDVQIELPTGSRLRGEVGVSALRSTGTLGECRYKTGAGDITVAHVAGMTDVITGTGTVRVGRIDGSATVKNSNGDIWIGETAGDLQVKAANGKITVDRAGASVTAKTANGDIHMDEVTRGTVVAATARGSVNIAVRSGVAAWLDVHTGFGQVQNLLEASEQPGASENTVVVRARSSFGDITIRHADTGDARTGAA
jgi:DUF4097 and DUF4098 domain-containing protein YvlB